MLVRQKYTVILLVTPENHARLSLNKYAKNLRKSEHIVLSSIDKCAITKNSPRISLDSDYFNETTDYKIPICKHPKMYKHDIRASDFSLKRSHTLFFAGDFRKSLYTKLSDRAYFKHIDRLELRGLVESKSAEISGELPKNFIQILDNATERLTPSQYINKMASVSFFLALPGIHMPLSHNIAEALSVGTIPFIHISYATLLSPPLTHMLDAYVYQDFNTIGKDIFTLSQLATKDIHLMSINATSYYENYLSESAVVQNLLSNQGKKVRLIAEWNSIPKS
jgi:hypothetical protein